MKLLDVYPKDVYTVIELSKSEIRKLLMALEGLEITVEQDDLEKQEAVKFLGEFDRNLMEIMKGIDGGS